LTKLFDSMAKLKFRQENEQDTKIALSMSSKDGEEVKLSKQCDCDGQVGNYFFTTYHLMLSETVNYVHTRNENVQLISSDDS